MTVVDRAEKIPSSPIGANPICVKLSNEKRLTVKAINTAVGTSIFHIVRILLYLIMTLIPRLLIHVIKKTSTIAQSVPEDVRRIALLVE